MPLLFFLGFAAGAVVCFQQGGVLGAAGGVLCVCFAAAVMGRG